MSKETIKIGICGSQKYEDKRKIQETMYNLKETFGEALQIISGGRKDGADKYVKKYALEFGIEYREFNPSHTKKNLYSVLHENFYSKQYSPRNFFIRNSMMIKHVDYMIVFVKDGLEGADINHVIDETLKKEKKLVILE